MRLQTNPLRLKLVAVSFLIIGIVSIVDILYTTLTCGLKIKFEILGIFIYFGLLRHKKNWRTLALIWDWLYFITLPLSILGVIFHETLSKIFEYKYYPKTTLEFFLAYFIPIALFTLAFLQYKVLTNEEVKLMFINK